jgi:hypothetical protein
MAEDDDDRVSLPGADPEPFPDQGRADSAPLVRGDHRHRGERKGRHGPLARDDRQVAEEDVAHREASIDGHQREPGVPFPPELIDEDTLILPPERLPVDLPDRGVIVGGLGPDEECRGHGTACELGVVFRCIAQAVAFTPASPPVQSGFGLPSPIAGSTPGWLSPVPPERFSSSQWRSFPKP